MSDSSMRFKCTLRSMSCKTGLWELQDPKGKGKYRDMTNAEAPGILALDVPLELLGKPICKRSSAHMEAALHVIEVASAAPVIRSCTTPCQCLLSCAPSWAAMPAGELLGVTRGVIRRRPALCNRAAANGL